MTLTEEIVILGITLPLLWNILTVLYIIRELRKRKLTALKFSSAFVFGMGLSVYLILFLALTMTYGLNLTALGLVLLVFGIHALIGFPIVYYLSKTYLIPRFFDLNSRLDGKKLLKFHLTWKVAAFQFVGRLSDPAGHSTYESF